MIPIQFFNSTIDDKNFDLDQNSINQQHTKSLSTTSAKEHSNFREKPHTIFEKKLVEIKQLVNQLISDIQYSEKFYILNKESECRKFTAKQPEETKEQRKKIKQLLKESLELKFSTSDDHIETEEINCNRSKYTIQNALRFKLKGNWYQFSGIGFRNLALLDSNKLEKKVCRLSLEESYHFSKNALYCTFNGASLEYINIYREQKLPDSFWSGWKTWMVARSDDISLFPPVIQNIIYDIGEFFSQTSPPWYDYQAIIHPAIAEASLETLKSSSEGRPEVVEICGGDATLAINIAKKYKNPLNYYLLEFNDRSLNHAKYSFKSAKDKGEIQGEYFSLKADITNDKDYCLDADKKEPMQSNSIDLVIGSGALTSWVLYDSNAAFKAAKKCYELLKPKGKMILAGHAESFLKSEDFAAIGFDVLNTTLAGAVFHPLNTASDFNNQFYILEKPSGEVVF